MVKGTSVQFKGLLNLMGLVHLRNFCSDMFLRRCGQLPSFTREKFPCNICDSSGDWGRSCFFSSVSPPPPPNLSHSHSKGRFM